MFNYIKINNNIVVQPRAFFYRLDFVLIYTIFFSMLCILFFVFIVSLFLFHNYKDVYDIILFNIGSIDGYNFDLKIPGYKGFSFIFLYVFNLEFTYLSFVSGYDTYFESIWWFFANFINLFEYIVKKFNWWFYYHWFANYFAFNFQSEFLWWFGSEYIYPNTYDNSFHYYLDYRKKIFSRFKYAPSVFETANVYRAYRLWTWDWFKHFFPLLTIKLISNYNYFHSFFQPVYSIFYDPFYFRDAGVSLEGYILYIDQIRDADAHIYRSIRRLNIFLQMTQLFPFNESVFNNKYYDIIYYYLCKFNYNNIILNYYLYFESLIYGIYNKYYNYYNFNLLVFVFLFFFVLIFFYKFIIKFYNKLWAVNSTFSFLAIDFKNYLDETDFLTSTASFYFIQNEEDNRKSIFTWNVFLLTFIFNYFFVNILVYIEKHIFILNYFFYKLGFVDFYFYLFENEFYLFIFFILLVYFMTFFLFVLKYFFYYFKVIILKFKALFE